MHQINTCFAQLAAQQNRANTKLMQYTANVKSLKSGQEKTQTPSDLPIPQNIRLGLLERAQCSLNLEDLLTSLLETVNLMLPTESVHFTNAERNISVTIGAKKRSAVSYNLILPNDNLGSLTFSRRRAFEESELYILESFIGVIISSLRNALLYREALENALQDTLTKLGNRKAMEATLKRELSLARRNYATTSLIMADLDHFKSINDRYGHQAGDQAIIHATQCFKQFTRQTDQIFRYGGEEFLFILPDTSNQCAMLIAERIRKGLNRKNFYHNGEKIDVLASLGVASQQAADNQNTLFERADAALYEAKQNGRNCCVNGEAGAVLERKAN